MTDELVSLQRTANAARNEALAKSYSEANWRPWREAVSAVEAAVSEYAQLTGQLEYWVDMAVKKAARESP